MKRIIAIILSFIMMGTSVSASGGLGALEDYYMGDTGFVDLYDVPWAEDAIKHLAKYGVIHSQNGQVNPKRHITRAEFAELIVGSFGLYSFDAKCDFEDVVENSFYYPYVASLYELGIVKGVSEKEFGADDSLSRQDMATIIYRVSEKCDIDLSEKANLIFEDTDKIDDYAKDAVAALVSAGAVSGDEKNHFLPQNYSAFAEACKIIYYIILKNT